MSRPTRLLAAVAVIVVAGCASDVASDAVLGRDTVIVHGGDSVSVRIVHSTPDTVQRWRISGTPLLDIGAGDSEENTLYQVRGAYRLQDGRVVVADAGSLQLRYFDVAGALDAVIGRSGEGPGEFRDITWFGTLPGDSLLVWDVMLRRLTVFDATGARVRDAVNQTQSSITGVFDDGSMVGRGFVSFDAPPSGMVRPPNAVVHVNPDGSLADSIGAVSGSDAYFAPIERGFRVISPPFGRNTAIAARGDRLYIGDTELPEIRVLVSGGAPRLFVRWDDAGRRVTTADIERAKQEAVGDEEDDAARRDVEQIYARMPIAESMPVWSSVHVSRDGEMWVQRYRPSWEEGPVEWIVFDSNGAFITRVLLPERFRPTDIGRDYILGVQRDDMDVEHVRMYVIARNA